jgi:hypothetical protein
MANRQIVHYLSNHGRGFADQRTTRYYAWDFLATGFKTLYVYLIRRMHRCHAEWSEPSDVDVFIIAVVVTVPAAIHVLSP